MKLKSSVRMRRSEPVAIAAAMLLVGLATLACKDKGAGTTDAAPATSASAAVTAPPATGGDTCLMSDEALCFEFDTKDPATNEPICKKEPGGVLNKVPSCPKELRFGACRVASPAMTVYSVAEDGQGGYENAVIDCKERKGVVSPTPTKEILSTWTKQDITTGPLKGFTMLAPPHTKFEDAASVQRVAGYTGYFDVTIWEEKMDPATVRKDAQAEKGFVAFLTNTDTKIVWKVKDGNSFGYEFMVALNVGGKDYRCDHDEMTLGTEELANAAVEACLSLAKK